MAGKDCGGASNGGGGALRDRLLCPFSDDHGLQRNSISALQRTFNPARTTHKTHLRALEEGEADWRKDSTVASEILVMTIGAMLCDNQRKVETPLTGSPLSMLRPILVRPWLMVKAGTLMGIKWLR